MRRALGAYGRWLVRGRNAWLVIALVSLVGAIAGLLASQVRTEDDLLAFLPEGNTQIEEFETISADFGGLNVALIGVETEDVFRSEFLLALDEFSQQAQRMDGVEHVLSLTTVKDISPGEGGASLTFGDLIERSATTGRLILPTIRPGGAALRERVMSRDLVVGQLVSEDATSVLVYVFAAPETEPRALARSLTLLTEEVFTNETVHLGGAALISSYIYDVTRADMARLTPWAIFAILTLMLLAFRDLLGTVFALASTGLGILVCHASMSAFGVALNVVLSSMPIILFAVGSAYGIHLLARYQCHARALSRPDALVRTLEQTGPTITISALTTAVGLSSFVLMDIGPLRTFGLFTSVGILATFGFAITLIPAMILIAKIPGRSTMQGWGARLGVRSVIGLRRSRRIVGLVALGILGIGALFVSKVDTRVDQSAFYSEHSPPALSDGFMRSRFGGEQFIQVRLRADLNEPVVLRELQFAADRILAIPGVSRVSHVGQPLSLAEASLGISGPRIPDTRAAVGNLMGLMLSGERALGQLITDAREQALIQVQIRAYGPDDIQRILTEVEHIVERDSPSSIDIVPVESETVDMDWLHARVAYRIQAVVIGAGIEPSVEVEDWVSGLSEIELEVDQALFEVGLGELLRGEDAADFVGEAIPDAFVDAAAREVAGRTDWGDEPDMLIDRVLALEAASTVDPWVAEMTGLFLFNFMDGPLADAKPGVAEQLVELLDIQPSDPLLDDRARERLIAAAEDLAAPTTAGPGAAQVMDWTVSGLPMMHRGLSESVRTNQWISLLSALGMVAVILSVVFGGLGGGLLATAPMAAALICIYGGMGWAGIRLDIGTSMLASLVIGAGVDYAVHFLSAWDAGEGESSRHSAARAAARTGPAIWTNALMVASGFFVLTFGEARPLQNVGGLTASAMLLAALATFVLIPVLAGRKRYTRHLSEDDPADVLVGLEMGRSDGRSR